MGRRFFVQSIHVVSVQSTSTTFCAKLSTCSFLAASSQFRLLLQLTQTASGFRPHRATGFKAFNFIGGDLKGK